MHFCSLFFSFMFMVCSFPCLHYLYTAYTERLRGEKQDETGWEGKKACMQASVIFVAILVL